MGKSALAQTIDETSDDFIGGSRNVMSWHVRKTMRWLCFRQMWAARGPDYG